MTLMAGKPVTGKLFIKGWLTMARFISICRPETGAVRSQHFITQNDVALLVQTKFEFGVCNDDSF